MQPDQYVRGHMKLGVFFSNCDGVLSRSLDLVSLSREYEGNGPVKIMESFYEDEDFDALLAEVTEKGIDAVVLAGDTPFSYRQARNGDYLFRSLVERGVNPNRIEAVNLKNLVALPHKAAPAELQLKARLYVDVAIEKLKHAREIETVEIAPRNTVAVIGANLSAVALSQLLLDQGYKVFMITEGRKPTLQENEKRHIQPTLAYVRRHPRFRFLPKTEVTDFYGFTGDYTLAVNENGTPGKLAAGAVVLSPEPGDAAMIRIAHAIFHVDVKPDGTLSARDETSARSQTCDEGVFFINPPSGDAEDVGRKFAGADAAAAMVENLLNRREIHHSVIVSQVDPQLCSGCGACVKTCMFHAVRLEGSPPVSVIDHRRCRSCGNCVAACPSDARSLVVSPSAYLFNAVTILSRFKSSNGAPKTLMLACDGCGYPCLDRAGQNGLTWPAGVLPLRVVCGGQIDTQLIMHGFVKGFDKVVLLVCGEGLCHNIIGNVELERRVNLFREILGSRGLDDERMHVITTSAKGDAACVAEINRICA